MRIFGSLRAQRGRRRAVGRMSIWVAIALAITGCGSGPTAAPGSGTPTADVSSAGSTASRSPLIGSWSTTITKADLQAAGITDPGAQNENSGRFTFTFGPDGTWTQVQESVDGSPILNPVFRGTYVID